MTRGNVQLEFPGGVRVDDRHQGLAFLNWSVQQLIMYVPRHHLAHAVCPYGQLLLLLPHQLQLALDALGQLL